MSSNGPGRPWAALLRARRSLFVLVLLGVLLRALLVATAENRLDSDEAVVGVMALDVLEGEALPLFFGSTFLNRNEYNGGAAHEAYLAAAVFGVFGPSGVALKFCLLLFWTASALVFVDLCRRTLSDAGAFLAVLLFCAGTPFFLEWSVKARGGYAGTVLFSVLLLWLAAPPRVLRSRLAVQSACFGIAAGLALWSSEMIVALLPCAGAWLLLRRERGERLRAFLVLLAGAAVGLLPLLAYNLTHDWAHARASVLYSLLQPRAGPPLTLEHLRTSARFVLGWGWPLALLGFAVAGVRLAATWRRPGLGHVLFLHGVLYLAAYWHSGLRYLGVPPSRVLYALYPAFAVLLACAVAWPRDASLARRCAGIGAVLFWLGSVAVPVSRWAASGVPRETGSWRSTWSLADGAGLHRLLVGEGVDVAYVSDPTSRPLLFANRVARHEAPGSPAPTITHTLPRRPLPPGQNVAFALRQDELHHRWLKRLLHSQQVPHEVSTLGDFVVLSGIDSSRVHVWVQQGLPRYIGWPDMQVPVADGFN